MGKAYTEEERVKIRTRLLEAGLELFHDQGVREISIRELTKRAGIAQGGFYSFFPDKEALVIDIIHYRTEQKMKLFEETFDQSLQDPAAFVSKSFFFMAWDLKQKADRKQMYADILHLCLKKKPMEREALYRDFYAVLQKLTSYWNDHGLSVTVDPRGMINVFQGFLILYANLNQMDDEYSESLLRTFMEENIKKYIVCNKTEKEDCEDDQNL